VAIRALPPDWAGVAEFADIKQRFERQAAAVASLSHPHIGLLYDLEQHEGVDYLVTEYLEGDTLAARLERGKLDLDEAMTIALAIGDALDQAHRAGVLHRDLKPSNVILTPTGAKLLELGLAELRPSRAAGLVPSATALTAAAHGPRPGGGPGGWSTSSTPLRSSSKEKSPTRARTSSPSGPSSMK